MPTTQQLIRLGRKPDARKVKSRALQGSPQRRGVCLRVYTMTPNNHSGFDRRGRVLVTVKDGRWLLLGL